MNVAFRLSNAIYEGMSTRPIPSLEGMLVAVKTRTENFPPTGTPDSSSRGNLCPNQAKPE
jgi:hypothetical protein